ncbi:MAG: hypothetical protein M1826_001432, partial [Phylliscum demangeonii]
MHWARATDILWSNVHLKVGVNKRDVLRTERQLRSFTQYMADRGGRGPRHTRVLEISDVRAKYGPSAELDPGLLRQLHSALAARGCRFEWHVDLHGPIVLGKRPKDVMDETAAAESREPRHAPIDCPEIRVHANSSTRAEDPSFPAWHAVLRRWLSHIDMYMLSGPSPDRAPPGRRPDRRRRANGRPPTQRSFAAAALQAPNARQLTSLELSGCRQVRNLLAPLSLLGALLPSFRRLQALTLVSTEPHAWRAMPTLAILSSAAAGAAAASAAGAGAGAGSPLRLVGLVNGGLHAASAASAAARFFAFEPASDPHQSLRRRPGRRAHPVIRPRLLAHRRGAGTVADADALMTDFAVQYGVLPPRRALRGAGAGTGAAATAAATAVTAVTAGY